MEMKIRDSVEKISLYSVNTFLSLEYQVYKEKYGGLKRYILKKSLI